MIELYKKRGETPLEALTRLRQERPELLEETLSYAGRLDPMAEGILLVLVGTEENKNRASFLKKDKEYYVEFLCGYSTDTGDVLGVVQKSSSIEIDIHKIQEEIKKFIYIREQTYPWYSSKTVEGIPLFEYAQNKNFSIERPKRDMKIYSVSDIDFRYESSKTILENINIDIQKVQGDFRQNESIKSWKKVDARERSLIVSCTLCVSSGTYIRTLTETLHEKLGIPVVVYKLVRTKIS